MNDRTQVVAFGLGVVAGASVASAVYRNRVVHIVDMDGISVDREDVR